MARPCSVCTHPALHQIDHALVTGVSFRTIAAQHHVSVAALQRHKTAHIGQALAESAPMPPVPIRQSQPIRDVAPMASIEPAQPGSLDLFAQMELCVGRVRLLMDACDAWLRDPEDGSRYTVEPRASEIRVVYDDYGDCLDNEGRRPRRKRATLGHLLRHVEESSGGMVRPVSGETKYADPRELVIKTAGAIRDQLQLLVTVQERLYSVQQLERFERATLDAIATVSPETRDAIVKALQRLVPGSASESRVIAG
jgi:hypothetical protein